MSILERLPEPITFFRELGGLHDAKIVNITWNVFRRSATLEVDDLNANFYGLPEYSGKKHALIIFGEVEDMQLNCDAKQADKQRVYELEMLKDEGSKKYKLTMRISPSGQLNFMCEFVEIQIDEVGGKAQSQA